MTVLRFTTDHPDIEPGTLNLVRAEGRHRLSAPYEYLLHVEAEVDGGFSAEVIDQLLVHPCHLELGRGTLAPLEVHGVLRRIELLPMQRPDMADYHFTFVPTLWRSTLAYGSRIFQDLSWPEIVSQVLTEHGVTHELRLSGDYPAREYTVQYEESDFTFLSRLLEHWGIFYFFEQEPDGERMVLADDNSAFAPHPDHEVVHYRHQTDLVSLDDRGYASGLSRVHEVRPAAVDLRDYNWRHPQIHPEGEAPCDEASGHGTVYSYGDHIKDPTEGSRVAQIRSEELLTSREVYHGHTSIPGLVPGHKLLLNGYPSGDLDIDYVVTEVRHEMERERENYLKKSFSAIPHRVAYRPPREAPLARVEGTMHAIVDGEVDGTAAPIDELGRYKLVFPFDRNAEEGGRASRWVRMAQASTGANYGMHLPLHIGCEVAIQHLGGDPDRPVIVGALPNADTVSPVTRDDATKSRIRTRSGILIELEDDTP